jgi:hypothetical protein
VQLLLRLPALLCCLLCLAATCYSTSAAWVVWLGSQSPSLSTLQQILPTATWLGLPTAKYWLQVADLDPDQEHRHLEQALAADPRALKALLRLALLEEFSGRRQQARQRLEEAIAYHHSYESYMAALTQAARWKELARVEQMASLALRYSPRDADGVYAQLKGVADVDRVLAPEGLGRRSDYLRFLVGQKRLGEALSYQSRLPPSPSLEKLRLELSEALFWNGHREQASQLFGTIYAEFAERGYFNERFRSRPSSMGFDWRLSEDRRVQLHWRPGEMEVKLAELPASLEVLSILVEGRGRLGRVVPLWNGETEGLRWEVADLGGRWKRVVLVAPAGAARNFKLLEARFE